MAKPLVNEVFEQVAKLKTKAEKIKYLQQNNLPAVKDVLRVNFDYDIVSLLPEGKPPFKVENTPRGMSPSSLHRGHKRFKYFFKGPFSGMQQSKRESLFIGLLESIHESEAEMLCLAKDKKMKYKGLTSKVVQEAFPGLLKVTSNKKVKKEEE